MARPKKEKLEETIETAETPEAPIVETINPKLITEKVVVCKDELGNGGKEIEGIVSKDRKSVTTLSGVTFAL